MANKRKPLNLKKYKYVTEYLQDVDKEKKGIPTRGRMPKLERSLVTKKRVPTIKARPGPTKVKPKRKKRKPFEPYVTMEAKGGGKVEYKKHGGKVIKTNMSGDDVVRGCYD